MTSIRFSLFLLVAFLLNVCSHSKLYQVVSLFRHGARYHVNSFADGNDTEPLWGELTAVGMRQHQRFGELLRKEYIDNLHFLSPNYNETEIEVFSTHLNRTISSALSHLYGLYPPGTGQRIPNIDHSYHLPPYSNKTNIEEQNNAFPNAHQPIRVKLNERILFIDCPNTQKEIQRNMESHEEEIKEMIFTYSPFIKKLAPMFNYSADKAQLYTMLRVYDTVNVDKYLGRTLPQNFTEEDYNNVHHLATYYFLLEVMGNVSVMYSSGKLAKIFEEFDLRTKIPEKYPRKWTFLSVHDTDIFAMYVALNLSSHNCIEEKYRKGQTQALNCENGGNSFASSLIFELHSDDNKEFFVKLRSDGRYVNLCNKESITCEYSLFKSIYKSFISSDISTLCGRTIPNKMEENHMKLETLEE